MPNAFQALYQEAYEEISHLIETYVKDHDLIMDIGCSNGSLIDFIDAYKTGCVVYAIDTDTDALEELQNKPHPNTKVHIVPQDANDFLRNTTLSEVQVLLVNGALHELNSPDNQWIYLNGFFQAATRIMDKHGRIIIGDHYYHPSVSDKAVEEFRKHQQQQIGHADPRTKFIQPELVRNAAIHGGFSVTYSHEIRAVKEIDRRYYTLVLEKRK